MKRLIIAGLLVGLFVGCKDYGVSVPTVSSSEYDYHVRLLFEADGVKVYSFYDSVHTRYFAVRNSAAMLETDYIETHTSRQNGKSVTTSKLVTDGAVMEVIE